MRQFCRPRSAACGVPRLQYTNGMTRAGNFNGCRKAVGTRANNDRIEFHRIISYGFSIPAASRYRKGPSTPAPLNEFFYSNTTEMTTGHEGDEGLTPALGFLQNELFGTGQAFTAGVRTKK